MRHYQSTFSFRICNQTQNSSKPGSIRATLGFHILGHLKALPLWWDWLCINGKAHSKSRHSQAWKGFRAILASPSCLSFTASPILVLHLIPSRHTKYSLETTGTSLATSVERLNLMTHKDMSSSSLSGQEQDILQRVQKPKYMVSYSFWVQGLST